MLINAQGVARGELGHKCCVGDEVPTPMSPKTKRMETPQAPSCMYVHIAQFAALQKPCLQPCLRYAAHPNITYTKFLRVQILVLAITCSQLLWRTFFTGKKVDDVKSTIMEVIANRDKSSQDKSGSTNCVLHIEILFKAPTSQTEQIYYVISAGQAAICTALSPAS